MNDFVVGALAWAGAVGAVVLICWGINKLAAMEIKELQKFEEKESEE